MENWKVRCYTCMSGRQMSSCFYALIFCLFRSVTADIRVRIDGVEDEHGVIKVDKNGKACDNIARLFKITLYD